MAAAKAMLDCPHPQLLQPPSDTNTYALGEIAGRNVVLTCLPAGVYGAVSAANVVAQMRLTYPAIQFCLMVGIGGGVPSKKNDIRLGDIVVSRPTGFTGGVIQYDFGKSVSGGRFERTGTLNKPPTVLLTAMANLESQHLLEGDRLTELMTDVVLKHPYLTDFTRRGQCDQLFQAQYDHPNSQDTCDNCDLSMLVPRKNRHHDRPVIHYGLIASGDQVMKDGRMRDSLAKDVDILCFEMEAAGLMDSVPCLVIRGICDYSDSHKNKEWQNYAAVVAAVYARELLKVTPARRILEFSPCPLETRSHEQMEGLLRKIPRADGATFDSRANEHASRCLPNTRVDILDRITDWSAAVESKPIFWLSGMAGTGKTTIALTIAQRMKEAKRLGASFFFSRGGGSRGHAERLFTSLAYGLANASSELKMLICDSVEENEDFASLSLREQWKRLILVPICKFDERCHRLSQLVFVIVIDALDECDQDEDIEIFLDCIKEIKSLSKVTLRVLVTSRPEVAIRYGFEVMPDEAHQKFDLFEIKSSITRDDMLTFIASNLSRIGKRRMLPKAWPENEAVEILAERAGSLFIYAATVCRFIEVSLTPSKTLNDVLQQNPVKDSKSPYSALDQIYTTALLQVLDKISWGDDNLDGSSILLRVVGSIVLLHTPISRAALSQLLSIELESIASILSLLQSVLQAPDNDHDPVRLLHPSLRDFLLDPKRCTADKLQISTSILNEHLAKGCITLMSTKLHRDMCELHWPGAYTNDISQSRLEEILSQDVQYACSYWARHLYELKLDYQGCEEVLLFLTDHLLHWIECLSVVKEISLAVDSLNLIRELAQAQNATQLSHFLIDAGRFLLTNRYIIERAPLQLYSSAIIFSPSESVIRDLFWHEVPSWLTRFPSVPERWNHCLQVLEMTSDPLDLLVFSPDSRSLFLGTEDWDCMTGASLHTLRNNGLNISTTAACFSSDGTLMATASSNVHVWDMKTGKNIKTIAKGSERIRKLCFSQDGKIIATACSDDFTIRLWNVASGQRIHTLPGHMMRILSVAFVPGQNLLASQSLDCSICVWDSITGSLVWHLQDCFSSQPAGKISISSNGSYLASFFDSTAHIWNIRTQDMHLSLENYANVLHVAFSPDNELVAVGCRNGTVRIWNVTFGMSLHVFEGYYSPVTAIAFHPIDRFVASGHVSGRIQLWSLSESSQSLGLTGHHQQLTELVFSEDGRILASAACDGTVRVWNMEECIMSLEIQRDPKNASAREPKEMIRSWAHSPNGKLVAARDSNGKVEVWDSTTGVVLYEVNDHSNEDGPLEFSLDNIILAYGVDSTVELWDVAKRQKVPPLDVGAPPNYLAFTQGGKEMIIANEKVEVWSLAERTRSQILHDYRVNARAFCFSTDSSFIALPYIEHSIALYDLRAGKHVYSLQGHSGDINDLAFLPNSKLLASASSDTTVRIWDTANRIHLHTLSGHLDKVIVVLFSPDGTILASGSADGGIQLWDPKEGSRKWSLNAHQKYVTCLQFSPYGKWLASSSFDQCVRLWNPTDGKCMATLRGHSGPVTVLTCSPDGRLLASGSSDHTIVLWNPETGTLLSVLDQHHGSIQALEFSLDGMFLASGSLDQTVKLWDPLTMVHIRTIDDDLGHISSVGFSPDGSVLAIGSSNRNGRLWDPNSGNYVRRLISEGSNVLKFSPDGEIIACVEPSNLIMLQDVTRGTIRGFLDYAMMDVHTMALSAGDQTAALASPGCMIHLWNIASGQAMGKLEGHSSRILGLAFSPDGSLLASASLDKTVRLWGVESLASIAIFEFSSQMSHVTFVRDGSAIRTNRGVTDISHLVSPPLGSRDVSQLYGVCSKTHWLKWMDHDVLWLPADYRHGWRFNGNVLTIPDPSGGLSFMELSRGICPVPLEPGSR